MLLSDFTTTIGGRLDGLDQTVRDLLQLVRSVGGQILTTTAEQREVECIITLFF
jgi:hypothetical protein